MDQTTNRTKLPFETVIPSLPLLYVHLITIFVVVLVNWSHPSSCFPNTNLLSNCLSFHFTCAFLPIFQGHDSIHTHMWFLLIFFLCRITAQSIPPLLTSALGRAFPSSLSLQLESIYIPLSLLTPSRFPSLSHPPLHGPTSDYFFMWCFCFSRLILFTCRPQPLHLHRLGCPLCFYVPLCFLISSVLKRRGRMSQSGWVHTLYIQHCEQKETYRSAASNENK